MSTIIEEMVNTNPSPSYYKIARNLSLGMAVVLFAAHLVFNRQTLFLVLNHDLGKAGDLFFTFCTYLAEGWIWIPYFLIIVGYLKKDAKLILYHFVISTLLTQIPKLFIWNQVTRPIASGIDKNLIHVVNGMEIHQFNSFPSGHTATAFTLFLLTVQLFEHKTILILGLFYALFCGYSRVYLGQHFPLDIAGGIMVAILTKEISYRIYKRSNHV